jgi:uncharacterized membrane protein
VLTCFAERKGAVHAQEGLTDALFADEVAILDDVVVVVNRKGRARVHDPDRVVAGVFTAALTWGLFGLCSGGGVGLLVWGVLGAICGGAYAYFAEHVLTKQELQRVGAHLPANSSALLSFVASADERAVLACATKVSSLASVVAIAPDLSARDGARGTDDDGSSVLTMLLVRYAGEHGARARLSSPTSDTAQVELVFEVPRHGRTRVISPTAGVAAWAKSDVVSWGGFGVAFGLIVGFAGNGGTFGILEEGVVKGVLWGLFGLVAGALFGLWVGRAVSARRIKGLAALLPPDTATALVWLSGDAAAAEITQETHGASAHVAVGFVPAEGGAVLHAS